MDGLNIVWALSGLYLNEKLKHRPDSADCPVKESGFGTNIMSVAILLFLLTKLLRMLTYLVFFVYDRWILGRLEQATRMDLNRFESQDGLREEIKFRIIKYTNEQDK